MAEFFPERKTEPNLNDLWCDQFGRLWIYVGEGNWTQISREQVDEAYGLTGREPMLSHKETDDV